MFYDIENNYLIVSNLTGFQYYVQNNIYPLLFINFK